MIWTMPPWLCACFSVFDACLFSCLVLRLFGVLNCGVVWLLVLIVWCVEMWCCLAFGAYCLMC